VFEAAAYATAVVSQTHPVLLPLSFATALAQLVDRCGPACASVLRGATVAVVHLLAAALRVSPITTAGSVWDGSKWALGFLSRVQRRWSADLAVARAVAGVYTVLVAWSVPTYQKPAHCAFAWLLKLELDSVVPCPTPEGAWQELCGQWQRRLTCRVKHPRASMSPQVVLLLAAGITLRRQSFPYCRCLVSSYCPRMEEILSLVPPIVARLVSSGRCLASSHRHREQRCRQSLCRVPGLLSTCCGATLQ